MLTYKSKNAMCKNISSGNNSFFFGFSGSSIFWQLFVFLVLISKAQAAGYDEPIPSGSSPSLTTPNERLRVLSLLNWDKWEKPYWLNNNICRESQGNIICLSPQVARKIRWEVPSRNEFTTST
ncbi:MAG TPA: hypothetical protein V6D26_23600 [Stenomitos sp.]